MLPIPPVRAAMQSSSSVMPNGVKTPCAVKGDRCYDCKSPQRICRGLVVLWEAIRSCETEVVLVDEPLGY